MESKYDKYPIEFLIDKLDELYKKEDELLEQVRILYEKYEQLKEDEEMLKVFIMHKYNKNQRIRDNVFKR